MPTDDRLRLDDDEGVRPARPQPPKDDPEGSVGGPDERASPRRQGGSCTKGKVLEQEMAAGTEGRDEHLLRYRYESEHGEERLPCVFRNVNESRWHEVLANDRLVYFPARTV